jgi:enamine deaminase RidA (YjgF/YER057c/UK114 family)
VTDKRPLGPTIIGGAEMPWSKGVVAAGFVFLSGTTGATAEDGTPVGSIEAQTQGAFERARQALESAGSDLSKAVRINQYLADPDLRPDYVAAREAWLAENSPTLHEERSYASILVIQQLVRPEILIEIEVTALA